MLRLEELKEFREVRSFGLKNIDGLFLKEGIYLLEAEMLEGMTQ